MTISPKRNRRAPAPTIECGRCHKQAVKHLSFKDAGYGTICSPCYIVVSDRERRDVLQAFVQPIADAAKKAGLA